MPQKQENAQINSPYEFFYLLHQKPLQPHSSKAEVVAVSLLLQYIEDINTTPIDTLCKSGKVRKLNLQSEDNVYIYRSGVRERVIFSIKDKAKIVRDVITADELIKMKNG